MVTIAAAKPYYASNRTLVWVKDFPWVLQHIDSLLKINILYDIDTPSVIIGLMALSCHYLCEMSFSSFEEISESLDCCIIGLGHPINKNICI